MPARKQTFTKENILAAWETSGIIPFNPRKVITPETRKAGSPARHPPAQTQTSLSPSKFTIPRTPRAVSRATRTAVALVSQNTPSSQKIKQLLQGLAEGFQQAIADKAVEKEAHQQYRELVAGKKRGKTADCRKLTEATVVTSETVLELREKRERIDAAKNEKIARKLAKAVAAVDPIILAPKPPRKRSQQPIKKVKMAKVVTVYGFSSTNELEQWEEPAEDWDDILEGHQDEESVVSESSQSVLGALDPGDSIYQEPGAIRGGPGDVSSSIRRSGRVPKPRRRDLE